MRFRNGLFSVCLLSLAIVGCQSRPMVVVDVNRVGEGSDRIQVEFDRTHLRADDIVYIAQENLGPGKDRLTLAPDEKSMVVGDIRVRVIIETVPPTTKPAQP